MSLNLDALVNYVDETSQSLIKKSLLGGRTLENMTIMPGIKTTENINIMSSSLVAQAGNACGWNASGTTTLTTNPITVQQIFINEEICLDDLTAKWTQTLMNAGSYQETLPFEQIYAEDKVEKIQVLFEDLIWKGNTATGVGNMNLIDGFIRLADTTYSGTVVSGNINNYTAITDANVIEIVDGMVAQIPVDIIDREDLVIFCGYDFYRKYALALRNSNLFAYDGSENQGMSFSQIVPGTGSVRIMATRGLNGTNKLFLSPKSNLIAGVDLLNDFEQFRLWFSTDNQTLRFLSKFKFGVQAGFWDFVVYWKLA